MYRIVYKIGEAQPLLTEPVDATLEELVEKTKTVFSSVEDVTEIEFCEVVSTIKRGEDN